MSAFRRAAYRRAARGGLVGLALALLTACTTLYQNHGYAPSDADLAQIQVGGDTRDTVTEKIGAPGTSGVLSGSGWYYVESRYETYAYRAPNEIDRQVVAISFDPAGRVTNVERFGLDRGRVVALSRRVTKDSVQGVGFLRQLFGSFGRLNTDELLKR